MIIRSSQRQRQAAMPNSRPKVTPSGAATRIDASVIIALVHCPKTARNRKQAPDSRASGLPPSQCPSSMTRPMTAIQDKGGTIWTAEEPLPSRKPVESRLAAKV
jgi:hypothetical protein